MSGEISDQCRAFILDNIGSVVQLEALLLLRRSGTPSTVDALARELRIEPNGALEQLTMLWRRGLLERLDNPERDAYAPRTPAAAACVDALAAAYDDRRVTVISLIYSRPQDTVRVFADAFRLRKDEDDG
jgi:hypothetical protein